MVWYFTANILIALLGLFIARAAVQAYRQNPEPMMLIVAVGFVLISTHGVVEYAAVDLLRYSEPIGEIIEVLQIGLGMVLFFYALFGPMPITGDDR